MTLDGETIDALGCDAAWPAQLWAAAVQRRADDTVKYARETESNRVRLATDATYRERIRRHKRECEQRRRAARKASS